MSPEVGQFEAMDAKQNKKVAPAMPEDADITGVMEDMKKKLPNMGKIEA